MSYLSKYQYAKRNENASKRMAENATIQTLTEEQHDALSKLCGARHDLHSNMKTVICSDYQNVKKELVSINADLFSVDIQCPYLPISIEDYIDIDTIDELYEYEEVPEDDEAKQEWYDDNYHRIYSELEGLNNNIEKYLTDIDEKYGTNYCPTGKLRVF